MKIETEKLEILFQKSLVKLKELGIQHVEVNKDYYLLISSTDWTKFDKDGPSPVTGSLIDDWNCLSKVASGQNPMMFVDFDRLASILRAISDEINPE